MKKQNTMSKVEKIFRIQLKLLRKGDSEPISGPQVVVRLYDKDMLKDDYLGSATPNEEGEVELIVKSSAFRSFDSPTEKYPDLYVRVLVNGVQMYQSPVFEDSRVPEVHGSFSVAGGLVLNLGTFLIEE